MITKHRITKILTLLIATFSLGGCTSQLIDSMKGDNVYASLNAIPATITKAWDTGRLIVICIYPTNNIPHYTYTKKPFKNYTGTAVKVDHPFTRRYLIEKYKDKDLYTGYVKKKYVFSEDTLIYKPTIDGVNSCSDYGDEQEIPIVQIEEMTKKGFITEYKQAVYYQMKDNRIVSLGYFSAERMFDKYHNINIDLTTAVISIGPSGGKPLMAIFLPVTAVVDAIRGAVAIGAMAPCMAAGCK